MQKYLDIHPSVAAALKSHQPVVALESTIISHGMPYPENLKTAQMLEQLLKDQGVTPATIALIDGKIKIGLSQSELQMLAEAKSVWKTSRRDIPYVLSQKIMGATTVSATMIGAALAGISVFATGGIGGVHRGGEVTMDVSADLTELGQTNIAVVSAGAKSILDLPKTLEKLETLGVPVLGYQTQEFPSFYCRTSGLKTDFKMNTPGDIAEFMKIKWGLGLRGGVLVANPIPEKYALNEEFINQNIESALRKAESLGIKGKECTPFLLKSLKELTSGESLSANIELVKNNVQLAGQIAQEFCKAEHKRVGI